MYATVRKYKAIPGIVNVQQMRHIEEEFVPIMSQMPGFVAFYAVETGNDTAAAISIFEDQAAAEAYASKAADWIKQHHAEHVLEAPEVTAGEVHISKTKEGKSPR